MRPNAISCYANSTFCAGTTNQPFVLSLVFILLYQNPNFQIICTLSNGTLCYRSNNMYDFSTTKLNREMYLNRATLQNNMHDYRGFVFCCTDCCKEISLVQQKEGSSYIGRNHYTNSCTTKGIFQSDSRHTAAKRSTFQ